MDKVKDIITATLHTLDEEKVCSILSLLEDLGVETEDDLVYIVEDDLKNFLKPIQVRKLIATFNCSSDKCKTSLLLLLDASKLSHNDFLDDMCFDPAVCSSKYMLSRNLYADNFEAPRSIKGNSRSPEVAVPSKNFLPSCSAKESNVRDITYVTTAQSVPETCSKVRSDPLGNIVHWEKMPATVMAKLCSGQALEPSSRLQIAHLIADDILRVIDKPNLQEINAISQHIVTQYKSLGDTTGGSLGGCNYSSLSNQIMSIIDNSRTVTSLTGTQHTNNMPMKINMVMDGSTMFLVNCPTIKQKQCQELNSDSCSASSCMPSSSTEVVTLPQVSSSLTAESIPESSHETSRLQLLQNIVKWERMPLSLINALQSGNVLSKDQRCELVTLITNDILHVLKQPTRHEIDLLAEHIVNQFKGLRDESRSGHDFLCSKIVRRMEHLKRKPVSNGEQCIIDISPLETQTLTSESSICTNQLPNFSKFETGESLNPVSNQLEELDNSMSVDPHELETLIAQSYSEAASPESLKVKQNLMSELTKSFMTDSGTTGNSVAGNSFNHSLPKTSVSLLPNKKVALPQNKSVNNNPELTDNVASPSSLELENIVNWDRVPVSIMMELQCGNVLNPQLRRMLVRCIADDILHVIPHPRRREVYIIVRSCVGRYKSLQDRIGDSVVGNGCESLCYQVLSRIENTQRKTTYTPVKSRHLTRKQTTYTPVKSRHLTQKQTTCCYGCKNWSPKFPFNETEESLEAKRKSLRKLSQCCMINSLELESLITSTYYCQRKIINSGEAVSTIQSEWPLLFSDTGMMEHFKLLTGINLKEQLKKALTLRAKQILDFMCTLSNQKVKSCLQGLNAVQEKERYSEIFALLMVLSSYFDEDIASLIIKYEVNDPSDIGSLNVPRIPCLIGVGTSLLHIDHFMLVCDGVILNKDIKEDLLALCMLFASYFVLNYRYPKSNKGLLEFIQRCLAGINPPNGTKVEGGKNIVNRTLLRLCNKMNDPTWMQDITVSI